MTISAQHFIDASGLLCPEPIMLLHGAVRDASTGEIIELIATDPSTERDVKQFCDFLGHTLVEQNKRDDIWHHYIQKGAVKSA